MPLALCRLVGRRVRQRVIPGIGRSMVATRSEGQEDISLSVEALSYLNLLAKDGRSAWDALDALIQQ